MNARLQKNLFVFVLLLINVYVYVGEIPAWWAVNGYRISPKHLKSMQGVENKIVNNTFNVM